MPTYYIDPVNGLDTYAGDSFASGHPFKTLKKTFAAGDTILVAKNVETAQAGTVTAGVFPALTLSTTDNLTGSLAVYDIIRLTSGGVLDNTLYMVKAITSSVITLYRPYRGTVESGKTIYKLTVPTCASDDWKSTAGPGTAASHITLQCGINTSNLAQDGFTVLNVSNGTYGFDSPYTRTFWDISRLGMYYAAYGYYGNSITDCTFTDCFAFRCGSYGWYGGIRLTVNRMVFENSPFNPMASSNCLYNDIEIADSNSTYSCTCSSYQQNMIFNRLRITGYSGKYCFSPAASLMAGFIFNDCVFDENNAGITIFYMGVSAGWFDLVFNNLMVGSGTVLSNYVAPYGWMSFQNYNGVANDNRQYYFSGEAKYVAVLTRETSVYRTASPSGKVALNQSIFAFPVSFEIPCDAGVEKTVSVYFRKNSSYGSATLPTMRLRWVTGTTGAYVVNQYDVAMADTNDSFVLVSHAVTPAIQGTIKVDLLFQSLNSGAIAYFDDFAVV